jgi:hypothetical protein
MFKKAGLINVRHIPQALGTVALHVGIKRWQALALLFLRRQ